MKQTWRSRWAPSLGELAGTTQTAWGIELYNPETDKELPTVFFGLYGLNDFYALWRHEGRKAILWAGTDIIHFSNGYWLDEKGDIRVDRKSLARWINKNCESWTENEDEAKRLRKVGIKVKGICPSFMGNVNDYKVEWKPGGRVYASVSGDNFEMYGWHIIERIAGDLPWLEFHLYGNRKKWKTKHKNVIVHGRVSQEQMNREIKGYQIGLRLNEWDGFSEIVAKAILMGQYAISKVEHPLIPSFKNDLELITKLNSLRRQTEPNLKVRDWYIKNLNKYPWNYANYK